MQGRWSRLQVKIQGMDCSECEIPIVMALRSIKGVSGCEISYEKASGLIDYDPSIVSEEEIIAAIKFLGYEVRKE